MTARISPAYSAFDGPQPAIITEATTKQPIQLYLRATIPNLPIIHENVWATLALTAATVSIWGKFSARKKDAEPSVLLPAPAKGRTEQHLASAPRGVRHKHCFYTSRALRLRLVVLGGAVLVARATITMYSLAGCSAEGFNS